MAATLTNSSELTYISFPIEKMETTPDGDVMVWGKATDGSVDSDEQIVDTGFSSKAIADWLSTGANVRVQHNAQRDPAGVGVEAQTDGEGATWVKSLVVEPVAKRLVEKGVLRAYSVGIARPKIVRDSVARGGRIVDGQIVEISLVDRPANKSCGIQLVKSADDGSAQFTGKLFGSDVIAKSETVSVDLPHDVSVSFSPADLAKLLEHRRVAEKREQDAELAKRDMDPNVGGGVDRDKIPAEDFAGEDRSFPIVTPGDVSDAARSLGRARGQDTDKIKRRIIAIAHRKGPSFVAELPDAWKDGGDSQKADKAKKKGKKGKPFPGAAPSFDGQDSDHDGVDADKPGSEQDDDTRKPPKVKPGSAKKGNQEVDTVDEPEVEKGAKDCPKCGKSFHADSKLRSCDKCGADLPNAEKSATPDVSDAVLDALVDRLAARMAAKASVPASDDDDGDDGDDDDKPEGGSMTVADADKANKPTPGAGVTGGAASDIKPVPAHREPDGEVVEEFEHDAKLPTTPDSSVKSGDAEVMAQMRFKALGVPADMGALHDMLCAAYHPSDVTTAHPTRSLAGMDVSVWQAKALDAATGAPLDEAMAASAMWQNAVTIKGTDPDEITDIQWEAHKAFRDANPGPAAFPKPTELSPSSFKRPYISAGHAAASPGQDGPNTHAVPSGQTTANSFHRPYLDAGHAANSPSNKGDAIAAPVPTGEPNRVYYRNAQRETAKAAMQAMHDHIAATFPDLCPMTGPGSGGEAPIGQRPVPVPAASKSADGAADDASGTATGTATGVTIDLSDAQVMSDQDITNLIGQINKAFGGRVNVGLDAPKAATPDAVKSAVAEAVAPLAARLDEITEELKAERKRTKALQKAVDSLGSQQDPAVAAYKGATIHNPLMAKAVGAPVGQPSMHEIAERTQLAALHVLQEQARNDPDPAQREAAWSQIYKMTGLTGLGR